MAENYPFSQYYLPFVDDDQQNPSIQTPSMAPIPTSILSAFNRMNISAPSTPMMNRPLMDTTPYQSWDYNYLLEELNKRNEIIRLMQMNQGGLKLPYDNNSLVGPVYNDPHWYSSSKFGFEKDNCVCERCTKKGIYAKDYYSSPRRVSSNGLERCHQRGGDSYDEFDYYNTSRLQLSNPQFYSLLNTSKFTSLEELRGKLAAVAKDQHGCRFLQKKIDGGRKEDVDMIFAEIKDCVSDLMVDQFGNYLVQKLIDTCNGDQRNEILISVTRRDHVLVKICCDMHGTRAVQKLLERLTNEQQQARVVSALTPGTVILITDINGHHVIQYCVKHFPIDLKKYLLDAVAAHCVEIAMDRSGCCVLQLCVEHSHGEIRERLVAEITNNALVLAQDPYGNYVVQYLLGLKKPQYTAKLLRKLEGSFVSLSMQKFSSNVVERCLKESSEEQATQIVKELVNSPDVVKLLQDAFGNYVVQSALQVSAKTPAFFAVVELVKVHDISLRSHPYGKRILSKIEQLTK
ncbi:hypothetical protein ACHQM5_025419 [Ranunculus cassubicifolius]